MWCQKIRFLTKARSCPVELGQPYPSCAKPISVGLEEPLWVPTDPSPIPRQFDRVHMSSVLHEPFAQTVVLNLEEKNADHAGTDTIVNQHQTAALRTSIMMDMLEFENVSWDLLQCHCN